MAAPATSALAMNLSAEGAASFNFNDYGLISTPSPMVAGEATFGISDLLQLGAAVDYNYLSYANGGGSGSLLFYGALARLTVGYGLFGDLQAGLSQRDSLGSNFSWGLGAGIHLLNVGNFEVSPRVSYRFVPDSSAGRSLLDLGVLLTFKIL
jgi:hypothetical protein